MVKIALLKKVISWSLRLVVDESRSRSAPAVHTVGVSRGRVVAVAVGFRDM